MACFIVPAVEAAVTTVIKKTAKNNEKLWENSFIAGLDRLNNMLLGGSALLAFEHIWHGEIVPFFPFFTGTDILREMAVSGTGMAALVTCVWAGMTMIGSGLCKKHSDKREYMKQV